MKITIQEKFETLCRITRSFYFAWRETALKLCPQHPPREVINKFWEIIARQTAESYLKKINPKKPLSKQIAESMVWSSVNMGEDARVVKGKNENEYFVEHRHCPWFDWHRRLGLLSEDQPGCDTWFFKTVELLNQKLGTKVKIETQKSLPCGGDCCRRRIWV